jgi:gluconolactonase
VKGNEVGTRAFSPRLRDLIEPDAAIERVATGFGFVEGPVWHQKGRYLLFSDLAGDVVRRRTECEGIVEHRRPSSKSNGLTYDGQGRLIA